MSSLARLTALNNLTLRIGSYSRPYPHIIFLRCHRKEDYNIANDDDRRGLKAAGSHDEPATANFEERSSDGADLAVLKAY
eukprot:2438824-Pyramimonas_sp.AAC.1